MSSIAETEDLVIKSVDVFPERIHLDDSVKINAEIIHSYGLKKIDVFVYSDGNKKIDCSMFRKSRTEYGCTFSSFNKTGVYNYSIIVEDKSSNKVEYAGFFNVLEDDESPKVLFFDVFPNVQKRGESVEIVGIASDNLGLKTIEVFITSPNGLESCYPMNLSKKSKYVYEKIYNILGKYRFQLKVTDKSGNTVETKQKKFWITENINDTDNDGIPNYWEIKNGLNPENPYDANIDLDGDGIKNLDEYKNEVNTGKDSVIKNLYKKIDEKSSYILFSLFLFLSIISLSLFGERRKSS
ncbi:MAG: Ig-like domain repeat protein [Candidatus Thermoplasmatota archaeon]